jgi:hypothetical protein
MTDSLIPVTDEQAKAIQEALKALQGLGGYMKDTFGTMPQDIVALLGGDYLKVRRAENLYRMIERAKKRLEDNHVSAPDAPPSLAIPIMIAAADESRDELQDMWAGLMAAAADPKKSRSFRLRFIGIVQQMDPLDALVLAEAGRLGRLIADSQMSLLSLPIGCRDDEVAVSLANLESLQLASRTGPFGMQSVALTPLARELLLTIR